MDPNINIATILSYLRIAANLVDTVRDNPEFIAARATAGEAGQQAAAGLERAQVAIRSLIENNPQHADALKQQLTVSMRQYFGQFDNFTERFAREPISRDLIQRFITQVHVATAECPQQISTCTEQFIRNAISNDPGQLFLINDLVQGFSSMVRFVGALQEVAHVFSTNEAVVAAGVAVEDNMDSVVNGLRGFAANLIADPRAGANLVAACARFVAPQAAAPQAAAPQAAAPQAAAPEAAAPQAAAPEAAAPQAAAARQNSYRTMTAYGLWAASGVAAAAGAAYLYLYNRP